MLKVVLHGQIGLWRTQRKRLLLAVIQTKLFKMMSCSMPSNLYGTWHRHLTFLQSLLSLCMMTQDVTRNLFRSNAGLLRWSGWSVTGGNSKIALRNGSFRVTYCNLYHLQSWCHMCTLRSIEGGMKIELKALRSPTSSTLQWKKWAPAVCMVMALTNCPAPEREIIFRWKLRRQTKKNSDC